MGRPIRFAPAGSAAPGAIAAISRDSDFMDVFWISEGGPSGRPGGTASGAPHSRNAPAGSAAPGAIAAISRDSDFMDVFFSDAPSGAIWSTWWNGQWGTPFEIGASGFGRAWSHRRDARDSDFMDVFWIATSGAIWSTWWNGECGTPF